MKNKTIFFFYWTSFIFKGVLRIYAWYSYNSPQKITCSIISQNPILGTLPSFSMSSLFALYCLCLLYTVYVCLIPSLFVLYRICLRYTFFVCFLPSLFALYCLCLLYTVFVCFIPSFFALYRLYTISCLTIVFKLTVFWVKF